MKYPMNDSSERSITMITNHLINIIKLYSEIKVSPALNDKSIIQNNHGEVEMITISNTIVNAVAIKK